VYAETLRSGMSVPITSSSVGVPIISGSDADTMGSIAFPFSQDIVTNRSTTIVREKRIFLIFYSL